MSQERCGTSERDDYLRRQSQQQSKWEIKRCMTDVEYIYEIERIKRIINEHRIEIFLIDDTTPGCKRTYSSCGLCQLGSKQSRSYHKCPFDMRKFSELSFNGCFYTCYLKKHGYGKTVDLKEMRQMVQDLLEAIKPDEVPK